MADNDEDIDDLGASVGQKSSKIVTILIFVNILISGAALFKILSLPSEPVIVNTVAPDGEVANESEPDVPGPIHSFEPFLVNLNEPGGGRFLRTTLEVEVRNDDDLMDLQNNERKVRDEVLRYLSNLRVDETLGETNRIKIQEGITARLSALLGSDKIARRIYFPDFVVQ